MFKDIKYQLRVIWKVLSPSSKKGLITSVIGVNLAMLMEFIGLGSIIPFIELMGAPNPSEARLVGSLYVKLGSPPVEYFLIASGIFMGLFLLISSGLTYWSSSVVSKNAGLVVGDVTNKLFGSYLAKSYSYHVEHSSVSLAARIGLVNQLWGSFFMPIAQIISRLLLCALITVTAFMFHPYICLFVILFIGGGYGLVFWRLSGRVQRHGEIYLNNYGLRQKTMTEGLRGIKDVKISGMEMLFHANFSRYTDESWVALARKHSLSTLPRHFIESFALGAVVVIALVLRLQNQAQQMMPVLTMIGILGYKLLPSGHQVYHSLMTLKGAMPTMKDLMHDLSTVIPLEVTCDDHQNKFTELKKLQTKDLTYTYNGSIRPSIKDVSIELNPGERVAIVGTSGAGKSTLLDVMLGLYHAEKGEVLHGGKLLNNIDMTNIRKMFAYVPQAVYLAENSLEVNVAFGFSEIDRERLEKALYVACLDEVIVSLPNGTQTILGENGVRISGGQRQRVGLARAFYRNTPAIVLDEATSALDPITEKEIMRRLRATGRTVLVVTHRLTSVAECDNIYVIKSGEIVASGNYDSLMNSSSDFVDLVKGQMES